MDERRPRYAATPGEGAGGAAPYPGKAAGGEKPSGPPAAAAEGASASEETTRPDGPPEPSAETDGVPGDEPNADGVPDGKRKEKEGPGWVYVLTNEAYGDLIKIGETSGELHARVRALFATPVPGPFEVYCAVRVGRRLAFERLLHDLFDDDRYHKNREFFSTNPERVATAIRLCSHEVLEEVVGAGSEASDETASSSGKRASAPNIVLAEIGIRPDAILAFKDDPSVTATVVQGNKVEFDSEIMSISAAANRAIEIVEGQPRKYGVSGSQYWMHDGETLEERRKRMQPEIFSQGPVPVSTAPASRP